MEPLIFVKKIGDLTAEQSDVKPLTKEKGWGDETEFPEDFKEVVSIKHTKGPLFFGSTSDFQKLMKQIPESASIVIIRMERMQYIDQSGLYVLEDELIELVRQGKTVLFVDVQQQPRNLMEQIDIIPDLIPKEQIFNTFNECTDWIKKNILKIDGGFKNRTQTKETQNCLTPKDAHNILVEGNKRFVENLKVHRNYQDQVFETSKGQYPFAAILSCIDSRVPVELVFDLGIGDIFSVRVAGNVVNKDVLGSMEYACKVAGSKIVVVMGHTKCGAVTAACKDVTLGNITELLDKIKPAINTIRKDNEELTTEQVEAVSFENVNVSIDRIRKESPILAEMEKNGEIEIVGASYDVSTGLVEFH